MMRWIERRAALDEDLESRPKGVAKIAWVVGLGLLVTMGMIGALLGVVTLVPWLGIFSTVGSVLAPTIAPLLSVIGFVVLIVGIVAARQGFTRAGRVAAVLGGIGTLTNAVSVGVMVAAAHAAGGSVNLVSATFGLSGMSAAKPDKTIVYDTTRSGDDLSVSIYEPRSRSGAAPTIMFVHGGGWTSGQPNFLSTELRNLADDGYLVISVEYELATKNNPTWQVAPAQVACAATWIANNADSIGADMKRLAFWGESAGGNLAINTAETAALGQAKSSCGGTVPVPQAVVVDFPGVDVTGLYENTFDVAGISTRNFATTYTGGTPSQYPDRYASVNSATYLSSKTPNTLLMVNTRDDLVYPVQQYEWANAARKLGVDVEIVKLPLANHASAQFAKNSLGSQGHLSIAKTYLVKTLGTNR